jgi:hypothetical protein
MDTGPAPFTEQTARAMLIRYTRGDSVRGKVMSVGISRGNDAFRPDVDQAIGALHDQLVYEIGARKGRSIFFIWIWRCEWKLIGGFCRVCFGVYVLVYV